MKLNALAFSALALFTFGAQAQTARPAAKAASEPMNEASLPSQYKVTAPKTSVKPRDAVKAEAKASTADGLAGQGERSMTKSETAARATTPPKASAKSRDEVKAEGKAAASAGPAGQGERSLPKNETPTK